MSEKRFFNSYFTEHIIDKKTDKCYPVRYVEGVYELTDLLNEQQATISQLQDLCGESDSENAKLRIENEQLRKSVEYWQKKYEQGTETFQIIENDTTFQFNSNQAQLYTIKNVSPNGVVRLGNGHKAQWRMKDIREISQELPPFEEFNHKTLHEIRKKLGAKFDKDVLGRIIFNIYKGTFGDLI